MVNRERNDVTETPGVIPRQQGLLERLEAGARDDLYGEDSFPASDAPSTWWGESDGGVSR